MSEIFENAVTSIILGIEDFETGSDERMLSAARNYYAGLLLLAKECLVNTVPAADAMDVISAKFKPVPDGNGGAKHVVLGYTTVDLSQLQQRFKDFGLAWPKVNIKQLQQFRNNLEHYHLKEPTSALREAIASSFPMIVDFFKILDEDPQEHLADVWDAIITERDAFEKVRANCVESWKDVEWPAAVENLDQMSCPNCQSTLIGQSDNGNTNHQQAEGKCFQCGEGIDCETMMEMVVKASYEIDAYFLAKNGMNSPIGRCPECSAEAYVEEGETSLCFYCGVSIAGKCSRCHNTIDLNDYNPDDPNSCSYCANLWEKTMRE